MVVGGSWINPLQTLPQGLVLTFEFEFDVDVDSDPDPDPELDNTGCILKILVWQFFLYKCYLQVDTELCGELSRILPDSVFIF